MNFNELPIAKPASASFAFAMLAARTQDAIPEAADEVFVSALANGKVYVAYGSIKPKVEVPACLAIKADYDKKADKAADDLQSRRIDRKAYDKLGDLSQQGEDAYKKCFTAARAAAAVICRGDEAGRGAAGGGDGKIAPDIKPCTGCNKRRCLGTYLAHVDMM